MMISIEHLIFNLSSSNVISSPFTPRNKRNFIGDYLQTITFGKDFTTNEFPLSTTTDFFMTLNVIRVWTWK